MPTTDDGSALDRDAIKTLVHKLSDSERTLFREVILTIREVGPSASPAKIDDLAKKYADRARKLAADKGESD